MNKTWEQPQAVFFDIDGTTFQHNIQDTPASTYVALEQLKAKGIKLAACTSRVGNELSNLSERFINLLDGLITCAGGVISTKEGILAQYPIHNEDVDRVCDWCKENNIVVRWSDAFKEGHFDYHVQEDKTAIFEYLYHMKPTLQPHKEEQIVHLLTFPPMEKEEELRNLLKYSNLIVLSSTLEVTAPNISKASGISTLAKHWQIDMNNTIAVGDGKNDIDMFKAAAYSIAMGQSCDEVKQAASYTTTPLDQDGFYLAFVQTGIIEDTLHLLK